MALLCRRNIEGGTSNGPNILENCDGWQTNKGVTVQSKCRILHKKCGSVSWRRLNGGSQKSRQCAGKVSRLEHKNGCKCPRNDFRVAAKNDVSEQAPFPWLHPRNFVSVVELCPLWQPKICVSVQVKCRGWHPKMCVGVPEDCPGRQPKNCIGVQAVCRWWYKKIVSVSYRCAHVGSQITAHCAAEMSKLVPIRGNKFLEKYTGCSQNIWSVCR
jgi:hypothetical protein